MTNAYLADDIAENSKSVPFVFNVVVVAATDQELPLSVEYKSQAWLGAVPPVPVYVNVTFPTFDKFVSPMIAAIYVVLAVLLMAVAIEDASVKLPVFKIIFPF